MQIESAKDLDPYKLANEFATEIFEIRKDFHRKKNRLRDEDCYTSAPHCAYARHIVKPHFRLLAPNGWSE
jgi:hypothetical protein